MNYRNVSTVNSAKKSKPNQVQSKSKPISLALNKNQEKNFCSSVKFSCAQNKQRSRSLDPKKDVHKINQKSFKFVNRNSHAEQLDYLLSKLESLSKQSKDIEDKPSSIFSYNNRHFLKSLRGQDQIRSSLAQYMKMSREILDDFTRFKFEELDQNVRSLNDSQENGEIEQLNFFNNSEPLYNGKNLQNSIKKQINTRPKSATSIRKNAPTNRTILNSRSLTKLSSANSENEEIQNNHFERSLEVLNEDLEPSFHKSLNKISSIANWERQIRYELEIERELQKREIERQREKLQNDQRKLEEWDKQLRIELDVRERKIHFSEEELTSKIEEFNQKNSELLRKEQMINEIVTERIKTEMKFEIEKLRKKFNELEKDKSNLNKKEERVKEVEARLHEQVKIVKEKIDNKRLTDIELAKYRRELEIVKKENEVLKEKVESMEDYQVNKFENRALKNELQILKETLQLKNQEIERDRERWEKEQRSSDQKISMLKSELWKIEHESKLQKQKVQSDQEELNSKYEAATGQVKRLQAFIKDHLAQLNQDFSKTTKQLTSSHSLVGPHHRRQHSLYLMSDGRQKSRFYHQRSVSMDGYSKNNRSSMQIRGCRLCDDIEKDGDCNNNYNRNGNLLNDFITEDIMENSSDSLSNASEDETKQNNNKLRKDFKEDASDSIKNQTNSDEFVRKIVDQVYEKMSNQLPKTPNKKTMESSINELIIPSSIEKNGNDQFFSDNLNKESFSNNTDSDKKKVESKTAATTSHNRTDLFDFNQPPVHRTLYEELYIASKMDKLIVTNGSEQISPSGAAKSETLLYKTNQNDTNNNKIEQRKKQDIPPQDSEPAENNQKNPEDSQNSQSESFEIDW